VVAVGSPEAVVGEHRVDGADSAVIEDAAAVAAAREVSRGVVVDVVALVGSQEVVAVVSVEDVEGVVVASAEVDVEHLLQVCCTLSLRQGGSKVWFGLVHKAALRVSSCTILRYRFPLRLFRIPTGMAIPVARPETPYYA
jgi:hypothetical protein